jgi:hypothetical protein
VVYFGENAPFLAPEVELGQLLELPSIRTLRFCRPKSIDLSQDSNLQAG